MVSYLLARTMLRAQLQAAFPSFITDINLAVDIAHRCANGESIDSGAPKVVADALRIASGSIVDNQFWYACTMATKDIFMFVSVFSAAQKEACETQPSRFPESRPIGPSV